MAISDAQYTAWLDNGSAARCILVEVVARIVSTETTLYLSTRGYFDTTAGQEYEAIIAGNSVQIEERLSLRGESELNFGDIELVNSDGALDGWLDYVWVNREISVYVGDVTWDRADFRPILLGVVDDIDSRNNETLNIKINDKLARINTPVSENKLGGSTANKNELIPLCFGEPFNISPLLADPATLDFRFHDGQVEALKETRSNGVIAGTTDTLSIGKFVPDVNPQGTQLTCSPQGDKPSGTWLTTAKEIIERLVTNYGEVNRRFVSGDLDSSNLSTFDAANQQNLGIYLATRENVGALCNQIANSVGAQMVMSRTGKLQLHTIDLPASGTAVDITEDDILDNTLEIAEKLPVIAAVTIGYGRNWTVQENLDTGVPQENKDSYSKEWLTVTSEDATTKTNYKLDGEPEQINTFLLTETDATAEADRRLALFKTQRYVFTFSGAPRLIELQLGDRVTLTHSRFGLSAAEGMVVGMTINWESLLVNLEVFV